MKKFLYLSFFFLLLSGNAYAENITIKCVDEKRDVKIIINFDEGGDWIKFNGREKEVSGRKDDGLVVRTTMIEITKDKIDYFYSVESMKSHMVILINRFDGSMYQYGKLEGKEYDYNYMCEKSDRKF
jgi:hypothetical protein|tara:strand:+ start:185 stop:565 length:381 start_codon:yes stop_codon:yes gene_type:complete